MSPPYPTMVPLRTFPVGVAKNLRGVLFDLDDTLLDHGVLHEASYAALWKLQRHGLVAIGVTGRPLGWAEVIARQWPILGAVAENGAVTAIREGRGMTVWDPVAPDERAARRAGLSVIVAEAREVAPKLLLADDAGARRTDVTWDIGERGLADEADVAAVERVALSRGARCQRSSVHLHATFDVADKATGAAGFLARTLGIAPDEARAQFVYVGDSPNDAAAFAAFPWSVGVANVAAFVPRLPTPPRFVTEAPMGAGFAELVDRLLALRS